MFRVVLIIKNMVSIATFIVFISFYLFYNTSKKTLKYNFYKLDSCIDENILLTKIIATILLIISIVLNIYLYGFGAGSLLFFILFMTIGSLIIIATPLKLISYKSVLYIFMASLLSELFIF